MWNRFFPYKILKLSFLDHICQNVNKFFYLFFIFYHASYHINVSQDIDSLYEIYEELYIDINI